MGNLCISSLAWEIPAVFRSAVHEAHKEETRVIGRRFFGKTEGKGLLGRPSNRLKIYSNSTVEMGYEYVG
jgi:hypothetical protein